MDTKRTGTMGKTALNIVTYTASHFSVKFLVVCLFLKSLYN